MNEELINQLQEDIRDLMLKYAEKLSAGEINECIVGMAICTACAVAVRLNPNLIVMALTEVEKDHILFINENMKKIRKYYEVANG